MNIEKYHDIEEEHKELNDLIQEYKEEAYRNEMAIKEQKKYIGELEGEIDSCMRNIERRDE
jgi:peptidoglycan hydrolase CwlO-like protein